MEQVPGRGRVDSTVGYEAEPPRASERPPAAAMDLASSLAATSVAATSLDVSVGETLAAPDARELSLGMTIAAPLPAVSGPTLSTQTMSGTNNSVLPRVSVLPGGVSLMPSEGPRYATVKPLGAGAMGEVALVEDRDIGRTVALKRLVADARGSAGALARFVDEVRTVGKLEHPNIVPIHDVGVDEQGRYFFVMKFVDGETLESILEKLASGDAAYHRLYDITRRIEIFIGILRALQYAHARGIIHRDIKPANIMIGRFGEVVLMDWGVARPIGGKREGQRAMSTAEMAAAAERASSTHHGALIGTPLYMSPEQAAGNNDSLDARSDLYAACVVFHEMLQLSHRFADAKNVVELLNRILTTDPPPVTRICLAHPAQPGGVPAELGHFLVKGLQRDPEKRWQTAEIMISELHRILDGDIHVQCMATFAKKSANVYRKLVDRNPGLAISMMLASATTFLGLTAYVIADLVG